MLSAAEGGDVGGTGDEWGVEDMACGEKVMHPLSTRSVGHDSANVRKAIAFSEDRFLFLLSNLLSI